MATMDDYSIYLRNTFDLANTLTIKSLDSVNLVNDGLILDYGAEAVDLNDPTSWKYYKNICGEYHVTDTLMKIVSLDTLEEINFTRANLDLHPDTEAAYQYGTRYYYSLVSQYPLQEQLILGILYPANKTKAVESLDGTILAYKKDLVEPQEATLIADLSQWLQRYLARWHVRAFTLSDDLYPAAHHAIMYMCIVPKLLNLRLKRCKTNEAHTFHIRQYLASHGHLDRYMDYMTLEQVLFLYRNIDYLEHHVGQTGNFSWMIQRLLNPRYIPIANHTMKHLDQFNEDYFTEYTFKKSPINTQFNTPQKDFFTLEELLTKENVLAPWNDRITRDEIGEIDLSFRESPSGIVQTKDLESSMVDYTDAVPFPIADIVMSHWGYLSNMKDSNNNPIFNAYVTFNDAVTNDTHTLNVADAYIYLMYVTLKIHGIKLLKVPEFNVSHVRRIAKPTIEDLMSVVDVSYAGNIINQYYQYRDDSVFAQYFIEKHPEIMTYRSASSFFKLCEKIYACTLEEWAAASREDHYHRRAMVENMARRMYCDMLIQPNNYNQPFAEWLSDRNLIDYDLTLLESQKYIKHIFTKATGYYVDPRKIMANIQKAMIGTLTQLSSYSIQIIAEINSQPIKLLNNPTVRLGNYYTYFQEYDYSLLDTRVLDSSYTESETLRATMRILASTVPLNSNTSYQYTLDAYCDLYLNQKNQKATSFDISTAVIGVDYPNKDPDVEENTYIIGYENFLSLTLQQKQSIRDIWN